jgi:hypothetical protein
VTTPPELLLEDELLEDVLLEDVLLEDVLLLEDVVLEDELPELPPPVTVSFVRTGRLLAPGALAQNPKLTDPLTGIVASNDAGVTV